MKIAWITYLGALSHLNATLIPWISAHPPVLAQCKVHRSWALFREGTVIVHASQIILYAQITCVWTWLVMVGIIKAEGLADSTEYSMAQGWSWSVLLSNIWSESLILEPSVAVRGSISFTAISTLSGTVDPGVGHKWWHTSPAQS